jgi:hypothetical protein
MNSKKFDIKTILSNKEVEEEFTKILTEEGLFLIK